MGYSRFNGPQERRAVFVRSPLGGCSDLYDYCLDDPINLVDPEGLTSQKYGGADSAEEQPNLVDKDAGADSAQRQPQPNETDWKTIQEDYYNQKKNDKSLTVFGLDDDVDKQAEVSAQVKHKLGGYKAFVDMGGANKLTSAPLTGIDYMKRRRDHQRAADAAESQSEKQKHEKLRNDVSLVGAAVNTTVQPYGLDVDKLKDAARATGDFIADTPDRKWATRGEHLENRYKPQRK